MSTVSRSSPETHFGESWPSFSSRLTSKIRNVEFPDKIVVYHVADVSMKVLWVARVPQNRLFLVQLDQTDDSLVGPVNRGRGVTAVY